MSQLGASAEEPLISSNANALFINSQYIPASEIIRRAREIPTQQAPPQICDTIYSISNESRPLSLSKGKWRHYPKIHERVIDTTAAKLFLSDIEECRLVILCQATVSKIDLSLVDIIVNSRPRVSYSPELLPYINERLLYIEKSSETIDSLLTDLKERISDENPKSVKYSHLMKMAVGILVAGILVSTALFTFPLLLPSSFVATSQLYLIVQGISLVITSIGSLLSIYEIFIKCHEDVKQNLRSAFVDDLSQECDYLNQLNSMITLKKVQDDLMNAVNVVARNNAQEVREIIKDELNEMQCKTHLPRENVDNLTPGVCIS